MIPFALWIALVMMMTGGCAPPALPPLPPPIEEPLPVHTLAAEQAQMLSSAYTLGPADALQITVYENPDLSQQVLIGTDGAFVYPLIGPVQAAGLTVRQLEERIAQRLADGYLVNPQVTVSIMQYGSRRVYVLGAVRSPGVYPLRQNATLLEIISAVGGVAPNAGGEVIVVKASPQSEAPTTGAGSFEERISMRIDLEKLLSGEVTQPIPISSGDTIYVPAGKSFYVSGEVRRPGRYPLEKDTTVFKAITLAGGLTDFASQKYAIVRREVDGQLQDFLAQMNDRLQAEDILIIPESSF